VASSIALITAGRSEGGGEGGGEGGREGGWDRGREVREGKKKGGIEIEKNTTFVSQRKER